MIEQGIHAFRGKSVLLLQGPVGPFFSRLAHDLELAGATVHKVNFNAGDCLFYRRPAWRFKGSLAEWPAWLEDLLMRLGIQVVLLFGDCRPIHVAAHKIAQNNGIEVGVFEEGYLRPHFVTFERHGVNGYSQVPRDPDFYLKNSEIPRGKPKELGNTYWHMALWAFLYFSIGSLGKPWFWRYQHHRALSVTEAWPWLRSGWRKVAYRLLQRDALHRLSTCWDKKFFLVPLQVFNDSQIFVHSKFDSIESFIEEVLISFAQHAPSDAALVIKHHPMSRGYTDYSAMIRRLARSQGVAHRCFYIHDQHLPTLLKHARGVVVINSTVGLQALQHKVPVKALGEAIFNIPGMCHQGPLDAFWREASAPDPVLLRRFVSFLIASSQLNGSFYKRSSKARASKTQGRWMATDWNASFEQARSLRRAAMGHEDFGRRIETAA